MRALLAAVVGASIASPLSAAEPGFTPVEVHAHPIKSFRTGSNETRFGALEFRGGLTLSAPVPDFGSWSGLDFGDDGTLYAVSDNGVWFSARLVEDDGALAGVEATRIAPMLDDAGKPLKGKETSDAEGLRITQRNGVETALVSFEQRPDVRAFAAAPDFASARPTHITLPKPIYSISPNTGLEAIAVAPADGPLGGGTVVIAERSLDRNGNHRGFILDGPRAGLFWVRRSDDFDITDAVFLPGSGDLAILERKVGFPEGFSMRIRRIAANAILPGATVDGTVLLEADSRYQIDNMEGIAARPTADGGALLTLISDDNHSFLQRTVLLQFALPPDVPPRPRPRPDPPEANP